MLALRLACGVLVQLAESETFLQQRRKIEAPWKSPSCRQQAAHSILPGCWIYM